MARDIDNTQDILDSREVEARINDLESTLTATYEEETGQGDDDSDETEQREAESSVMTPAAPVPTFEEWLEKVAGDTDHESEYDAQEYRALVAFREEAGTREWIHGETLIRDSYFETYARELADDIGAVNSDAGWPNNHIDWEAAAEALQMDYSSAEFDGVTYWFRS